MRIHTASEAISLARKLEEESASFYESLSQEYAQEAETFLAFAKENQKYVVQVERAYREVITDAIEGGYAFDLESDEFALETALTGTRSLSEALQRAIEIEQKLVGFYSGAAEQAESLMADVPRAFKMVARKRNSRLTKLESLAEQGG